MKCLILGHKWNYIRPVPPEISISKRECLRCGRRERYVASEEERFVTSEDGWSDGWIEDPGSW